VNQKREIGHCGGCEAPVYANETHECEATKIYAEVDRAGGNLAHFAMTRALMIKGGASKERATAFARIAALDKS